MKIQVQISRVGQSTKYYSNSLAVKKLCTPFQFEQSLNKLNTHFDTKSAHPGCYGIWRFFPHLGIISKKKPRAFLMPFPIYILPHFNITGMSVLLQCNGRRAKLAGTQSLTPSSYFVQM